MNFLTIFILLIAEDTFDGGDVPFFAAGCQDAVLHTFFSEKHRFYAVEQLINCANCGII